jgi:hypothetical protein
MLRNGARLRNLQVIGGPVVKGQSVRVDFTTAVPTIIVVGKQGITQYEVQGIVNAENNDPYILPTQAAAAAGGHIIKHNTETLPAEPNLTFVGNQSEVTDSTTSGGETIVSYTFAIYHNNSNITNDAKGIRFEDTP